MPVVTIETRAVRDLSRRFRQAARAERAGAERGISRAAYIMDRDLKTVAFAGKKARRVGLFLEAPAQFALGVRSGQTAASVTTFVVRRGNEIVAASGSALPHVLWNERGATVRPVRARALAMPTVNALTRGGDLRNVFAGHGSLRDARPFGQRMFVHESPGGSAWLAARRGERGRLVLFFLLRRIAHVPARYAVRTAKRRVEPEIVREVGANVVVAATGAFRG